MEKALKRRIEAEVSKGTRRADAETAADEFMEEFTSEFAAVDPTALNDAPASDTDTSSDDGLLSGMGVDLAGDSYDSDNSAHRDMLDRILADDELTDELIERLVKRYEQRGDSND